jgi:transposase
MSPIPHQSPFLDVRGERRPISIDGETLLRTLLAWQRGEPRVCSMVVPPTPEEEDRRRISRERKVLLEERIKHVNRIVAVEEVRDTLVCPDSTETPAVLLTRLRGIGPEFATILWLEGFFRHFVIRRPIDWSRLSEPESSCIEDHGAAASSSDRM